MNVFHAQTSIHPIILFQMNIRIEILAEHSKRQTTKIVNFVGDDKNRFKILMDLFLHDEYRVVQRSGWMVSVCSIAHPQLIKPYFKQMVAYLSKEGTHSAVRRNILRILQFVDVPKSLQGKLVDVCFKFLISKEEPVAVKVFAMTVLTTIAKQNPDLKHEIKIVIEDMIPYGSPGIRVRGKKMLRELNR